MSSKVEHEVPFRIGGCGYIRAVLDDYEEFDVGVGVQICFHPRISTMIRQRDPSLSGPPEREMLKAVGFKVRINECDIDPVTTPYPGTLEGDRIVSAGENRPPVILDLRVDADPKGDGLLAAALAFWLAPALVDMDGRRSTLPTPRTTFGRNASTV